MPIGLIDLSNSQTKIGCTSPDGPRFLQALPTESLSTATIPSLFSQLPALTHWLCASVVPDRLALLQHHLGSRLIPLSPDLSLGFTFDYPNPHEIGADRLANAAALAALHPLPAIAIDAGTAVTFEVLDAHRRFLGGCILPGPDLMLSSLHHGTARLPSIQDGPWQLPARSTAEAMRAGTFAGFPAMVHAVWQQLLIACGWHPPSTTTLLTGGHALHLLPLFTPHAEHDPLLTLRGLHQIACINPSLFSTIP